MNHSEARLLMGADPGTTPPDLAEHLAGCRECSQFQREMVTLDVQIRLAFEKGPLEALLSSGNTSGSDSSPADGNHGMPTSSAAAAGSDTAAPRTMASVSPISAARQPKRKSVWSGWAMAASVAVASVLVVWLLRPTDSLAHDVVTHIEYESASWSSHEQISAGDVKEALAKAGAVLDMNSDKIMYAHSCLFHGHIVPHLVVSTPSGPVTVMVLVDEHPKRQISFHEDGMSGVITPGPHASLAVIMQGNENIDAVADEVSKSVHWLP
jgi:Protein of unknown function (DUF3379)